MSDNEQGYQPEQPAPAVSPAAAPPPATPLSSMLASLSPAEMLIAGGGLLIVATDLIFVIFGPYDFSPVVWAAAAASVALVVLRATAARFGLPYAGLLTSLATLVVLVSARELVEDLIALTSPGGISISFLLGMVGLYVGVAAMAYGALLLWRGRTG